MSADRVQFFFFTRTERVGMALTRFKKMKQNLEAGRNVLAIEESIWKPLRVSARHKRFVFKSDSICKSKRKSPTEYLSHQP